MPLWTEIGDLMPLHPQSKAAPHLWRWDRLLELAAQAGRIVPVGRGGERRAIALANPSLGGKPLRDADAVGRDPVPDARRGRARASPHAARVPLRRRGRRRLDGRQRRPGAHVARRLPAAGGLELACPPQRRDRADGLDRRARHPVLVLHGEPVLRVRPRAHRRAPRRRTPERSRSERLWGHPGLRPVSQPESPERPRRCWPTAGSTPIGRSTEQLALEDEGHAATLSPGHAAVRFTNPTTGRDVLPTIRDRDAPHARRRAARSRGARSARRSTRCSTAPARHGRRARHGRSTAATCSSCPRGSRSPHSATRLATCLDLFRFSDAPIFEALHAHRSTTISMAEY